MSRWRRRCARRRWRPGSPGGNCQCWPTGRPSWPTRSPARSPKPRWTCCSAMIGPATPGAGTPRSAGSRRDYPQAWPPRVTCPVWPTCVCSVQLASCNSTTRWTWWPRPARRLLRGSGCVHFATWSTRCRRTSPATPTWAGSARPSAARPRPAEVGRFSGSQQEPDRGARVVTLVSPPLREVLDQEEPVPVGGQGVGLHHGDAAGGALVDDLDLHRVHQVDKRDNYNRNTQTAATAHQRRGSGGRAAWAHGWSGPRTSATKALARATFLGMPLMVRLFGPGGSAGAARSAGADGASRPAERGLEAFP